MFGHRALYSTSIASRDDFIVVNGQGEQSKARTVLAQRDGWGTVLCLEFRQAANTKKTNYQRYSFSVRPANDALYVDLRSEKNDHSPKTTAKEDQQKLWSNIPLSGTLIDIAETD
jgi:hypothetical protein